eukprot:c2608_g1_i1 orf=123-3737(+)
MDKRSWPWRKKPSERPASLTNESLESSTFHSSRHFEFQDVTTTLPDHGRMTAGGTAQWQDDEEQIKVLNDKLSAALLDAASKEVLAKQHAKLAEEAVSGWETVEAEAAALKQQLESTIQQKLATEDRVSHLDGALKECMRQLRSVREEQEENIHNAIVKKTRDWDRKRSELEAKFADLEQNFLEKDAENRAMSRSLQERARSISELSAACSEAQTEVSMLQVRIESLEKEKTAFKYELNVALKELEIRNEERGMSKRAADAATKQHMEDVKRIAKLEAECQRVRSLVRKKLPGPGAIAQMKLEVEGPGSEKHDYRKKNSKGVISPRGASMQLVQEISQDDNHQAKEEGLWLERYSSLEEETKMLREILAKRNNELQSARLMCARTASKLSAVEQQLEASNFNHGRQKMAVLSGLEMQVDTAKSPSNSVEPSLASVSEDGNDGEVSCAESWASALIAELDQFKKGKLTPITDKTMDALKEDLDDFMEMEQLASLRPCDKLDLKQHTLWDHTDGAATEESVSTIGMTTENNTSRAESLTKVPELQDACQFCKEVNARLAAAEEELAKVAADKASLISLRKKLSFLFEESANVSEVLEQIRADIGLPVHSPANMKGFCPDENPSYESTRKHSLPAISDPLFAQEVSSCSLNADSTLHDVVSELSIAVCNVAQLVRDLAVDRSTENQFPAPSNRVSVVDPTDAHNESLKLELPEDVQLTTHDIDANCQRFMMVSKQFLNGDVDISQLMVELSLILSHISRIKTTENSRLGPVTRKSLSCRSSIHTSGEMEFSGVGSPMSDTSKSECSEAAAKIVPADENTGTLRKDYFSPDVLRLEEELRKVQLEKAALETHMESNYRRFCELEQELLQLKAIKEEMEATLMKDKEEREQLRVQIHEAEEMLGSFQTRLAFAEASKQLGEMELNKMASSKEESDSQLHACKTELSDLHDKLEAIAEEILNEQKKNSDLEAKCKELQNQLEEVCNLSCPQRAMAARDDKQVYREMEIAAASEKLAECERTILVLGHQLKALASPKRLSGPEVIQSSVSSDQIQSDFYVSSRNHSYDSAWEMGDSARCSEPKNFISNRKYEKNKDLPWDPRESIASDILDSELLSLSGQTSGRKMFDMFGDKVPVHEDYIEAVAQMPSSPETEPTSPKRLASKPPHRKKRSPRSFVGIDMSKSMNDACSPSTEKHVSSFSRFFARTKSTH